MNDEKNLQKSEVIRLKDLSFLQKAYVFEILKGMYTAISQIFKPKFTIQYPEVKIEHAASFRGRPVLVEENGTERCVACGLCSRVCPALAIEVQAGSTELAKERYPEKFEINMTRCIFCGFCEEVCPEEAIIMSSEYELAFSSQAESIFGKDKLLKSAEEMKPRLEFLRKNR
ncbi:MAG: NADH-quinone oxidoreductase subunit I [Bacteriovoracaceae bacterium]|nr:NADH-quinone oxidoreductase subunit I [Bacteroidota bacterium]